MYIIKQDPEGNYMSIKQGDYLKKLRTQNHLSQEKLAEKLGVSRQSISKWEQGYAVPDTDNMLKLSKLYGLSVDDILNCGEITGEEHAVQDRIPNAVSENGFSPVESNREPEIPTVNSHSKEYEKKHTEKKKRSWLFAAYPFIAVFVMVALGVLNSGMWKTSWIFLLTIPLFYTGIFAYEKKNLLIFFYPAVVLILFFIGGFHFGLWHPLWILFLTIPIYYVGAAFSAKNKKHKK